MFITLITGLCLQQLNVVIEVHFTVLLFCKLFKCCVILTFDIVTLKVETFISFSSGSLVLIFIKISSLICKVTRLHVW